MSSLLREARVLAEELVENTREAELARLKGWLKGRDTRQAGVAGIGWLHGAPGIGKSLLMARLAEDLGNAPLERQRACLHRFRSGDAPRNRCGVSNLLPARGGLASPDPRKGGPSEGGKSSVAGRRRNDWCSIEFHA